MLVVKPVVVPVRRCEGDLAGLLFSDRCQVEPKTSLCAQNRQCIFLRIFFEEEPLMCLYTKNKKQLDKTLLINSHLQRMFG